MTWHDFDGEGFSFRQQKTGVEIYSALSHESLRMLAETPKRAITIIVGDIQGKPIRQTAFFGKIFREVRASAEMRNELTFHDLRRTAATEASAAGANVEHITGHIPGSSALKHYITPNKETSRRAQAIRYGEKDSGTKV